MEADGELLARAGNARTSRWPLQRGLQSISQMLNLAPKSKYEGRDSPQLA